MIDQASFNAAVAGIKRTCETVSCPSGYVTKPKPGSFDDQEPDTSACCEAVITPATPCSMPPAGNLSRTGYRNLQINSVSGNCFGAIADSGSVKLQLNLEHTGFCETECPFCLKSGRLALKDPNGNIVASDCLFEHIGDDCTYRSSTASFELDTSLPGSWSLSILSGWARCEQGLVGSDETLAEVRVEARPATTTSSDIRTTTATTWVPPATTGPIRISVSGEDSGVWLSITQTVDGRHKYEQVEGTGSIEWNSAKKEWQMSFLDRPFKYGSKVDSEEVPHTGWELLQEAAPITFGSHGDKSSVAYCAERACEGTE